MTKDPMEKRKQKKRKRTADGSAESWRNVPGLYEFPQGQNRLQTYHGMVGIPAEDAPGRAAKVRGEDKRKRG